MPRTWPKRAKTLAEKYPPSAPSGCVVCLSYCARPGWWTVAEAARAMDAGYTNRMMLEMEPEHTFGVLSPAFQGNKLAFAQRRCAGRGCTFLKEQRCELHGSGFQPLECRFCHHERVDLGPKRHSDIESGWHTPAGQALVVRWSWLTGFLDTLKLRGEGSVGEVIT